MFWEVFVMLCKSKGLTANAVCKELGFSNATATKWKKGADPSGKSLQKIATYFGVSTDYLLNGTPYPTNAIKAGMTVSAYIVMRCAE